MAVYSFSNAENNKIGEKGCLNLLKAPLHNIILIDISTKNYYI